jgi:hypothetical protein
MQWSENIKVQATVLYFILAQVFVFFFLFFFFSSYTSISSLPLTPIPAPLCPKNAQYLTQQKEAFLKGEAAPDFPQEGREVHYNNRAQVFLFVLLFYFFPVHSPSLIFIILQLADLTELGKAQLGIGNWKLNESDSSATTNLVNKCSLK